VVAVSFDFHLHDSYFVVAHFHYVMGGTVVFALFGAIYFWWPKVTGRRLSDRLGTVHFWMLLIGFHLTFAVMHILGYQGLPRRVADYPDIAEFERWNVIITLGYALQVASMVPFVLAIVRSLRRPATAGADPWGANSLEWSTTSPPPHHNFVWLPPIRSERPTFDFRWINDPDVSAVGVNDAWRARQDHDERWFPIHEWVGHPEAEPTGEHRPAAPDDDRDPTAPPGDRDRP
jgi:cytochrome c oxidase subunit 1